jgi:hypothetical protein
MQITHKEETKLMKLDNLLRERKFFYVNSCYSGTSYSGAYHFIYRRRLPLLPFFVFGYRIIADLSLNGQDSVHPMYIGDLSKLTVRLRIQDSELISSLMEALKEFELTNECAVEVVV